MPTLYSDNSALFYSIDESIKSEYVKQVIVIDNSCKGVFTKRYNKTHLKLSVINPDKNLFVNQSWNLGVSHSISNNTIIMNDDVFCSCDIYRHVNEVMKGDRVGICTVLSYHTKTLADYERLSIDINYKMNIERTNSITGWFYCIKTKLWRNIPSKLRIFYGDNYIFDLVKNTGYYSVIAKNVAIGHIGSNTVNKNKDILRILKQEHNIYKKFMRDPGP